jgi:hypothetical protein
MSKNRFVAKPGNDLVKVYPNIQNKCNKPEFDTDNSVHESRHCFAFMSADRHFREKTVDYTRHFYV